MQQLINFIIRQKNTLLYMFFMCVALGLTVRTHNYHQSKFFNSANNLSGGIYTAADNVTSYFNLDEENQKLKSENQRLRQLLFNREVPAPILIDTVNATYSITAARVVKNSFTGTHNYITIDKGRKDSIAQDMGVITPEGILGIVENTSSGYATVQSILNRNSTINAKIKGTQYFGSLVWNGEDYQTVQLEDIPRLVPLQKGDTILTGAMSSIFPEDIPIGTISDFSLDDAQNLYKIDIALFTNMANIKHVYIINNKNRSEIKALEASTDHDP